MLIFLYCFLQPMYLICEKLSPSGVLKTVPVNDFQFSFNIIYLLALWWHIYAICVICIGLWWYFPLRPNWGSLTHTRVHSWSGLELFEHFHLVGNPVGSDFSMLICVDCEEVSSDHETRWESKFYQQDAINGFVMYTYELRHLCRTHCDIHNMLNVLFLL